MRKITTFVTILVLVLMTFAAMPMNVSAEGDDMWSPVSNPTTSGLYKAINAVDIDGDGLDELLAGYAAYGNSKIEIWSYDPDTDTWTKDQTLGPPSSGYWADPHAIEPADLDNDGDLDLIVPTRGAGTYVFWNEGGGVWSDSKIDWSYGWSADVGDIDQDGNLDILLNTIPVLKIYYGDGQRGFTAGVCPESSYTAGMWGAYLVDMNNDGFLDLVASIMWGYEGFLRVYHYNGNRQWSADSGPGHTPIRSFLYTGDINEDGRVDIVTTVFRDINANDIDIYYQTEMGGWNKVPTINVPGESLDFPWVGDINKDGHLDIVAFGYLANGIQLYLGDGTGQFSSNKGIINNNWYITIAIGDFNGDSYPDIAADKWIVPMGIDVWFQLPKDPVTLIENLINDIEDMDLPKGIENSLVSKLENALKSLEKENYGAAINQMNAFINEVEAQSGKKIPEDEAVELEDDGHFVNEAILEKS